jgi:hypothetical protein
MEPPTDNPSSNKPPSDKPPVLKMPVIPQIPAKPVLDYASPNARSPLRMTNTSIIKVNELPDGTEIVEFLTEHGQAIGAIIFTTITMTILGNDVLSRHSWTQIFLGPCLVYVLFALGVLTLILAVIQVNWRQTILHISHESLTLTFKSPFKKQTWRWPTADIQRAHVVEDNDPRAKSFICELRIETAAHGWLNLFGGHDPRELNQLAELISRHLPGQ